jgi:hypothetical protein
VHCERHSEGGAGCWPTHDEEQLDEEADEPHHNEADGGLAAHLQVLCEARLGSRRLREAEDEDTTMTIWRSLLAAPSRLERTLPIRLGASLDQANAALGEVLERLDHKVPDVHGEAFTASSEES